MGASREVGEAVSRLQQGTLASIGFGRAGVWNKSSIGQQANHEPSRVWLFGGRERFDKGISMKATMMLRRASVNCRLWVEAGHAVQQNS